MAAIDGGEDGDDSDDRLPAPLYLPIPPRNSLELANEKRATQTRNPKTVWCVCVCVERSGETSTKNTSSRDSERSSERQKANQTDATAYRVVSWTALTNRHAGSEGVKFQRSGGSTALTSEERTALTSEKSFIC